MLKIKKRIALFFALLIFLMPLKISALNALDPSSQCSLTVSFVPEGNPAAAEFRLYKIADISENASLTLTDPFREYVIDLTDLDEEKIRLLTATLSGYIASEHIRADYSAKTDADGNAVFTELQAGLYLIIGDASVINGTVYMPESAMVCLPIQDMDHGWNADVAISVKWTSSKEDELIDLQVLKVWNDQDDPHRPEQVEIDLYGDDVLMDTVSLNKENNWQFDWTDLAASKRWSVKEKSVPSGYFVAVEQQGHRFVVTNTKYGAQTPEDDTSLPLTGVLWWPVPLLAACGLGLIIIGMICRKGDTYEK